MSQKNVVIIGTLDTKGEHIVFLKTLIERRGHKAIIIDLSTGSEPPFKGDITPDEIASLAGRRLEDLMASKDRYDIAQAMQAGTIEKIKQLYHARKFDGIVSLGGVTLSSIGSQVMKVLPFGMPKFIICTSAMPVQVDWWFDSVDVTIMQSLLDFAGLNPLLRNVIARGAGAVCGMVEEAALVNMADRSRGAIAITQWGFSEECSKNIMKRLELNGYTVYSFHASGIGDVAMERLISEGYFDGVIDIAPGGVMEEIFGGNRAAGPDRLEAAGRKGIPQVITTSGINLAGCGPTRRIDIEKFASRSRIYKIDKLRHLTRYEAEELRKGARIYAEKLNRSKGPVAFLVPLRGWSSLENEGTILYAPEEDVIFTEELRKHLRPDFEIKKVDCNLEDPLFAETLAEKFFSLIMQTKA